MWLFLDLSAAFDKIDNGILIRYEGVSAAQSLTGFARTCQKENSFVSLGAFVSLNTVFLKEAF